MDEINEQAYAEAEQEEDPDLRESLMRRACDGRIAHDLRPMGVPISELVEDDKNSRKHDRRNIEAIKYSLKNFGQQKPIVIRNGVVVAGNGTLVAARELGWEYLAASETDLENTQMSAFALADNRSAELARWDDVQLGETLAELKLMDADLAVGVGWSLADIDALIGPQDADLPADGVPELMEETTSARGEVFELGDHRLMCGDATSEEDMKALLCEEQVELLCTDPPYGVSYASKNQFLNARDKGNRIQTPIENDHMSEEETAALWMGAFSRACDAMKPGASYYVTGPQGGDLMLMLLTSLRDSGLRIKHTLIWAKNNHVLGRCDYHYKHEPILYGWKEGAGHKFHGGKGETSLWEISRPNASSLHPTTKPVALMERAIANSTLTGEAVLDPFLGSGTTLIAAARLKRRCYGLEISPAYCDVIRRRWTRWARENGAEPGSGLLDG